MAKPGQNGVGVENASAPGPAAGFLQGSPEAGVIRQVGVGDKGGPRSAAGKQATALFRPKDPALLADEIQASLETAAIDDDLDLITIMDLTDRAPGQRLRRDMADAGAGRNAGEASVGQDSHVLAEAE